MVRKKPTADPLKPSATLLIKLGSALIHADEGRSEKGHHFDWQTFDVLLKDAEVVEWLEGMRAMAFLPVKR